ncbi:aminotransferase class IV [Anaerobaca lacustris]|uniref:Aminotransferase class IV n=1 Tax=Anaerobaca lacustris TaxID=3044600 RepID=A0AAW6TYQ4_9BACT|nr:aminotransferase class IV [Sedimentisphaerales bacterium M17dextr]
MKLAMLNDRIVPVESLDPIYFDRGIYFGDGVYEVLRSYHGRLFALDDHLARFARSLAEVRITSVDIDQVRSRVERAFATSGLTDAKIYFHVTRGSAPRNHVWNADLEPNFFLTVSEVPDDSRDKAEGITVSTHPDWRWKRCDIKSLNLLANVLARQDAAEKGCGEAILVDEAGLITEGAGSGFFAILGRNLHTAPLSANILPSITRKFVIQAARNLGMEVVEQCLTPQQAAAADELFIVVTTKDIVPVVKFDDAVIGNGKPGPQTAALIAEFRKSTCSHLSA